MSSAETETSDPLVPKSSFEQERFDQEALLLKTQFESERSTARSRHYRHIWTVACLLAGALATIVILVLTPSIKIEIHSKPSNLDIGWNDALQVTEEPFENGYWCGHSAEEARSRGCRFDLVLFSWVPPQCYDQGLEDMYTERQFEWWRNENGSDGVSQEVAKQGTEEILWLNWDYHVWHCKHIWKMMTRVLRNSTLGIPGSLLEYEHTEHCINVLTGDEGYPLGEIGTLVTLNYSTCYTKNTGGM